MNREMLQIFNSEAFAVLTAFTFIHVNINAYNAQLNKIAACKCGLSKHFNIPQVFLLTCITDSL